MLRILSKLRTSRSVAVVASLSVSSAALLVSVAYADITAPADVNIVNLNIEESLTGAPGDAESGKAIFANKSLGNCLACHANSDLKDQLFHGEIGPNLDGVAGRWTEAQLRTIVVNAKAVFTDNSTMPGFYSLEVGKDVRKDLIGKTILTAEEVEDVVAYLTTLK